MANILQSRVSVRVKAPTRFFCCVVWLFAGWSFLPAAETGTGASMGMAGAYRSQAGGAEAPFFNPANLAWQTKGAFDMMLLGLNAAIGNNALSYSAYVRYNGSYLDEGDKQDILDLISGRGLVINGAVSVNPISISLGHFAVSTSLVGAGRGSMAQDIFTLLLRGNELDREYKFRPATGQALVLARYRFSGAHAFKINKPFLRQLAIGMNINYLHGYFTGETQRMQARALTGFSAIRGDGVAQIRHARGGDGFSLDLGLNGRVSESWRVSLTAENLAAQVKWSKEARGVYADFVLDATNIDQVFRSDQDLEEVVVHHDTTMRITPFLTRIPAVFSFGASFERRKYLIAGEYEVGVDESALTCPVGKLAFGAEYRPLAFLPLRAGVGFGGRERFIFSYGFGLRLKAFRWDWGFQHAGGVLPDELRGFGLATNLRFGVGPQRNH